MILIVFNFTRRGCGLAGELMTTMSCRRWPLQTNSRRTCVFFLLRSSKRSVQASFVRAPRDHSDYSWVCLFSLENACQKLFWLSKILNVYNFKFIISIFGRNWLIRLVPSAKWLSLSLLLLWPNNNFVETPHSHGTTQKQLMLVILSKVFQQKQKLHPTIAAEIAVGFDTTTG